MTKGSSTSIEGGLILRGVKAWCHKPCGEDNERIDFPVVAGIIGSKVGEPHTELPTFRFHRRSTYLTNHLDGMLANLCDDI